MVEDGVAGRVVQPGIQGQTGCPWSYTRDVDLVWVLLEALQDGQEPGVRVTVVPLPSWVGASAL